MPKGWRPGLRKKIFEKGIDILSKVCYTIDSERRDENEMRG